MTIKELIKKIDKFEDVNIDASTFDQTHRFEVALTKKQKPYLGIIVYSDSKKIEYEVYSGPCRIDSNDLVTLVCVATDIYVFLVEQEDF
ncbi:MAG: hypothetical protein K2L37_03630 [Lactobacillus sp.]|nr:hypothetical protein [Lactobacillus sp.]